MDVALERHRAEDAHACADEARPVGVGRLADHLHSERPASRVGVDRLPELFAGDRLGATEEHLHLHQAVVEEEIVRREQRGHRLATEESASSGVNDVSIPAAATEA